ncbi:hypothetical protein [Erythrobacter sp. EC-HK427]|uniref:hypothetical protein n=1 Tax=Erythrobacter sp. EC-HK427 TaxID=2038396 RepID=UPI00125483E0|nr:hypothetical protein [Erythrobacter sp. EC-HK427]VVT15516.1 conserved hypothetical protein [Erythrobacter sp. EC-HK427]
MNGVHWVSIIGLVGWLALAAGAYRSYQIDTSDTIRMALIWAAIFVGVAFVFSVIA